MSAISIEDHWTPALTARIHQAVVALGDRLARDYSRQFTSREQMSEGVHYVWVFPVGWEFTAHMSISLQDALSESRIRKLFKKFRRAIDRRMRSI